MQLMLIEEHNASDTDWYFCEPCSFGVKVRVSCSFLTDVTKVVL